MIGWQTFALTMIFILVAAGCTTAGGSKAGEWEPLMPTRQAFFPDAFEQEIWIDMAAFEEPRLDDESSENEYAIRYRLSLSGIACNEYVIRIDAVTPDYGRGYVKTRNKCSAPDVYDLSRFEVKRADLMDLQQLTKTAGLWKFYPEFWISKDENSICIDGIQMVIEKRNADGFGISIANAQCTAPPKVRDVAKKFIALSGSRGAESLVP